VALVAISYDAVPVLAGFAARHGIAYPLLSDAGSHAIRRLGLENVDVLQDHAVYGIQPNPRHLGVPYAGAFLLDERGIVAAKRFHRSYRERDTGAGLLDRLLGVAAGEPGGSREGEGPAVRVRAWLDSPTYAYFQRLHLHVELSIAAGHHVYAAPTPPGYVALGVEVQGGPGVEVGPVEWPEARSLAVEGLDEAVTAHSGTVHGTVPLTFTAPPGSGDRVIGLIVNYQACADGACLLPSRVRLALPLAEVPLAERALPSSPPGR
jgi:hypothetical protein